MVIRLNKLKIFLSFLCLLIISTGIYITVKLHKEETLARFPVCDKIIIIDAGHGGLDAGASSKSGLFEKDINLEIAKYLESYLTQSGAKVIMTRSEDVSLHNDNASSVREKKRSDLLTRKNKVNSSSADLFISIHQNYFDQSQYKGAQVFYNDNNITSKALARIIQKTIKNNLDNDNNRVPMPIDKSKILFKDLKVPAVLVECGFLSNPEEANLLNTKEYKQKMAFQIYNAIIEFFDNNAR